MRMRGVCCTDKYGRREVMIHKKGIRHYYGAYKSLEEANARARDVWQLFRDTGKMPVVVAEGDKPIGECRLAPAT